MMSLRHFNVWNQNFKETLKSLVFMNYEKYELCICIIDHYFFSKEILHKIT